MSFGKITLSLSITFWCFFAMGNSSSETPVEVLSSDPTVFSSNYRLPASVERVVINESLMGYVDYVVPQFPEAPAEPRDIASLEGVVLEPHALPLGKLKVLQKIPKTKPLRRNR